MMHHETVRNVALIAGLSLFVYLGFGEEGFKVESCTATVSKYVTAEFSDGDDWWSEAVSPVHTITKYNEMPEYPTMPAYDKSEGVGWEFDRFEFHVDEKLSIHALNGKESTTFTDKIHKTSQCLDNLGFYIKVKTWWYITYGSDFK